MTGNLRRGDFAAHRRLNFREETGDYLCSVLHIAEERGNRGTIEYDETSVRDRSSHFTPDGKIEPSQVVALHDKRLRTDLRQQGGYIPCPDGLGSSPVDLRGNALPHHAR